jgi:tRNA dimethylallyltransferase
MLIYKEPKIITSKPPRHMLEEVKHHFINMISVEENYNVFDYYTSATKKIQDLFNKNIPVIVCGGSGLYVKAILDGIFEGVGKDAQLRKRLEEKAKSCGKKCLYEELKKVDTETAIKISANDLRRIIRALEVYYLTGLSLSQKKKEASGLWEKLPIKIFGLRMKRRELYDKINKRVDRMFDDGAIKEVEELLKLKLSISSEKIIGIKEIGGYLKGEYPLEKAKEEMKKSTRHFAKRQITWFKPETRIEWIDADGLSAKDVEKEIVARMG